MNSNGVSRRDFIKSSLAASSVFSLPTLLPNSVFGADAPGNRINVGLIGCGNIGNYHKNWLTQYADTRIVAVCDAYKSRSAAMAEELNMFCASRKWTSQSVIMCDRERRSHDIETS